MFGRRTIVFGLLVLLLGLGCGPRHQGIPAADEAYEVRTDFMPLGDLTILRQPTRFYDPGYAPILMLGRTGIDPRSEEALLFDNKQIADTTKVATETRIALQKTLTQWFGTPAKPRVGLPAAELQKNAEELRGEIAKLSREQSELEKQKDAADKIGEIKTKLDTVSKQLDRLQVFSIPLQQTLERELQLEPETLERGGEVYRTYCIQCHGKTGNGRGPTGLTMVPMPRDYRQGLFKFVTSDPSGSIYRLPAEKAEIGRLYKEKNDIDNPLKRKPLRADLYKTITRGIYGAPMPQFSGLSEKEVQAVISYVIHLSIRGECESEAIKNMAKDEFPDLSPIELTTEIKQQFEKISPRWLLSQYCKIVPEEDPYKTDKDRLRAAANGYELFKDANSGGCNRCHIGYGKNAPYMVDSWGTIVRPRNLLVPAFRGGYRPEDIYTRLAWGIDGVGMPQNQALRPTLEERAKGQNRLWDLVHFVRAISDAERRQALKEEYGIDVMNE